MIERREAVGADDDLRGVRPGQAQVEQLVHREALGVKPPCPEPERPEQDGPKDRRFAP